MIRNLWTFKTKKFLCIFASTPSGAYASIHNIRSGEILGVAKDESGTKTRQRLVIEAVDAATTTVADGYLTGRYMPGEL